MMRTRTILFHAAAGLLLCLCLYMHGRGMAYGDKLWEITYASMWLEGRHIYTDIFPISPPLIFWLYALPVWFSMHFHFLSDLQWLLVLGICVLALSMFISVRLIALHPAFGGRGAQAVFAWLIGFILIVRTNTHYFLDREHLFFVLVFPYLLRWMPSLGRMPLRLNMRIGIGLMAGIGFCIKPQCFLIFAGVQLLSFLWGRAHILRSVENIIIYAVAALYVAILWVCCPAYFFIVLPMAMATYSATREETSLWEYSANSVYVLALTFLMFSPRQQSPYRSDILYFCGLCPFFLLYALTNNNWAYTYYPLSSIALFICGWVALEFVYLYKQSAVMGAPRWKHAVGLTACALVFLAKTGLSVDHMRVVGQGCYDSPRCFRDEPFYAELDKTMKPPASFGTISMDFTRWSRISRYSGAAWETRFPQLWMLPKFLISDAAFSSKHQWILDYVGNAYAADLQERQPQFMFVDDTRMFYTAKQSIDLVAYFSRIPAFMEAWKHYHFLHNINSCGPQGTKVYDYRIRCSTDVYQRD